MSADKPEDAVMERASAAPNLATAPQDGPDEPLLLHHDPSDGASHQPEASVGLVNSELANTVLIARHEYGGI